MPVPTGSSFDATFYLATYKDVKTAADAAVKDGKAATAADFAYDHWLAYGAREVRNPNAFFNTKTYLFNNADVQQAFNKPGAASLNPLTHYDLYGWTEKDSTVATDTTHRRSAATNAAFNVDYYTAANPSSISYGSPLAYFIAALRAAASATSTTTLGFAASAYAPTVAYLNFDYIYYLQKNTDVAKSILGDKGTVPANNAALTQIQKGKVLYHWFNYGQVESRVAHKIGSTSGDTASDFARITDPSVTAKDQSVVPSTATSYTATALDDTFTYSGGVIPASYATTITGWGGPDSTFIWDSAEVVSNITVSGVANIVFSKYPGKTAPADATNGTGTSAVTTKGYSLTATGVNATDMTFADATVTKLAIIHSGTYKVGNVKTVTGASNNDSMAFFNLGDSIGDLYIQGLTSATATVKYDLFGYKAAPANNTVTVTLNGLKATDSNATIDTTVINISSKSASDIKTIKINVQTASSVLTVMAADGDGTGTVLTEQKVSKLVITGGAKGVNLDLKDGVGTNTFDTLDVSGFNKEGAVNYTASYGNHTATVLGGSAALTYKSAHTTGGTNDLYGQTFQFGTTDMGTNKAGSLAAIKTVGTIDVTGIPAGSNIVDSFNLSTKIFGFTADNWSSITDQKKTYLYIDAGVLADSATTAKGDARDTAATGNDSYFYTLGSDSVGIAALTSSTASVDLTFGAIAADSTKKAHAAIVVLKDSTSTTTNQKMNIYYTDDNTQFSASHAVLIGSYTEGGTWGTGTGKIIDSSFFHVVA